MFGSVTDLPRFHNFQDAVSFYNNTKGIRGRENIKPLKSSRRSPDDYRIGADVDGGGNIRAIYCWLYSTPVLVYTPDRLIINTYNSMTTNSFINAVGPNWLQAYQRSNTQIIFIQREGEFISRSDEKIIVPVDDQYQPIKGAVEAAKLNRVVLNRTRAAETRKECQAVIALAETTSKMDGYWQALRDSTDVAPDEETAWLRGLLKIGQYRTMGRWDGGVVHWFAGCRNSHMTETELMPYLKHHLYEKQYLAKDCFDKPPAEYGVIPNEWEVVR